MASQIIAKKYSLKGVAPSLQTNDWIDSMFESLFVGLRGSAVGGENSAVPVFDPDEFDEGDLLFIGDGDGTVEGLPISSSAGAFLRSTGTEPEWSTTTWPNSAITGDLVFASAANAYGNLAAAAAGKVLRAAGASTAPAYSTFTIPDTFAQGNLLYASATNVLTATANAKFDGTQFEVQNTSGAGVGYAMSKGFGFRTYELGFNDPSGLMTFSRSDADSGLELGLFFSVDGSGTTEFRNDFTFGSLSFRGNSLDEIVFTPKNAGGTDGKVQFGRRLSDSSVAVGMEAEFWPLNTQTNKVLATMNPGGTLTRFTVLPSGNVEHRRDNGQSLNITQISELLAIDTAAFTDSTIQIPSNSRVFLVVLRVITQPAGTTTMDVGVSGDTTRYGSGVSSADNNTNSSVGSSFPEYTAATSIRITPNATPSSDNGRIRLSIYYWDGDVPTS